MQDAAIELRDDFEKREPSAIWSRSRMPQDGYQVAMAPERLGDMAAILTVRPGDFLRQHSGETQIRERCELGEKMEYWIEPGTDVWYGISFFIPEHFLVVDNRLVIAQWRTSQTTSRRENPPLSLRYINGELLFTIKDEDRWITLFTEARVAKGVWHDLLVNYRWGENHVGQCQAFLNGADKGKYDGYLGYSHLPAQLQFRFGLYRDHLEQAQSLLFSRFRRGVTREFCER